MCYPLVTMEKALCTEGSAGKPRIKPVYAFSLFIFVTLMVHVALLVLGNEDQMDIYFIRMDDFLADFLNHVRYSVRRDPYFDETLHPMHHNQAALFYILCWAAGRIAENKADVGVAWIGTMWGNRFLLLLTFYFLMASVLLLIHSLLLLTRKYGVSRLAIFPMMVSTMMLFAIERANNIIISCACVVYFITLYDSSDRKERLLGCLCLALAAVQKIYPVFFGFLYFEKKQYREIAISALMALVLFFAPFFFFRHGIQNFPRLVQNWTSFSTIAEKGPFVLVMKGIGLAFLLLSLVQRSLFSRLICIVFALLIITTNPGFYTTLYFFPLVALLLGDESNALGWSCTPIRVSCRLFLYCYFALLLMPLQVGGLFLGDGSNANEILYEQTKNFVFIIVFCFVLSGTVVDWIKGSKKSVPR